MDIVLLGAPGAGKGTQGSRLAEWLGTPSVSSGQLFREAMEAKTELGEEARHYVERGAYVPDDITVAVIAERLAQPDCARGAILDGFPRTQAQARALDRILQQMGRRVDLVAFIRMPVPKLVARLSGRMNCTGCGSIYHEVFRPPQVPGVCDVCGSALERRADDAPEIHQRRIEVYLEQTAPLITFYRERGILGEVDGDRDIEAVQQGLQEAAWRACRSACPPRHRASA